MQYKLYSSDRLMTFIAILGVCLFILLFYSCWFSPEMNFPSEAFRLLWLPSLLAFIFFAAVAWIGFTKQYRALRILIFSIPFLIVRGALGLNGIEYFLKSRSTFFLDANVLGFLEILLAITIFLAWLERRKISSIN